MTRTKLRFGLTPALVALTGLVLWAAPPAQAEVIFPAGSRIGLEPPPGMRLNRASNRFEDPDRKASITIVDVPLQLYSEMERMVFAEANQPNVTVTKRESFPFASGIGYFAAVRLTVDGTTYRKWILLASSAAAPVSDLAVVVSIQVPEAAGDAYPENIMRATLSTVTFRPPPIDERLALLPFVISDLSGFKIIQIAPTGVALADAVDPGAPPSIFVSVGPGGPDNADERARFARDLIQKIPLNDINIISAEPMRIRGTAGFEIKAQARAANGGAISVVQWIRFGSGGFLAVLAGAPTESWERLYPRFRAVRDGIEPR